MNKWVGEKTAEIPASLDGMFKELQSAKLNTVDNVVNWMKVSNVIDNKLTEDRVRQMLAQGGNMGNTANSTGNVTLDTFKNVLSTIADQQNKPLAKHVTSLLGEGGNFVQNACNATLTTLGLSGGSTPTPKLPSVPSSPGIPNSPTIPNSHEALSQISKSKSSPTLDKKANDSDVGRFSVHSAETIESAHTGHSETVTSTTSDDSEYSTKSGHTTESGHSTKSGHSEHSEHSQHVKQ